ncbi:MAG: methionine adenosyltransferase, partial [Longimicrobiales bacterium]|nr:methionine adenosyltransferase [Longimicrobiales bacterium]
VDIPDLARGILKSIGYTNSEYGIDGRTCAVLTSIDRQSGDIAQGVDRGGAGDQGMMFGFACDETDTLMPAPIHYAHVLTRKLAKLRKVGEIPWLRPDGKAQVTVEYDGDTPVRIHTVVMSAQHDADVGQDRVREALREKVIGPALPDDLFDEDHCTFHLNPTGTFVVGGPHGDAGLTGRKIIVDTYGGTGRHGGGAFSGKDATKVDRSGAYAARWAAKNLVAAGAAKRVEIQVAYAIGVVDPVSIHVESFGTGVVPDEKMEDALWEVFDFRPKAIIDRLNLNEPVFRPTSVYGHFGRQPETVEVPGTEGREVRLFSWEETDRVDDIRTALDL